MATAEFGRDGGDRSPARCLSLPNADDDARPHFSGMGFLTAPGLADTVLDELLAHGAHSVGALLGKRTQLDAGVVPDDMDFVELQRKAQPVVRRLRARRLPIFTVSWVRLCLLEERRVSLDEARSRDRQRLPHTETPALVLYDPGALSGLRVTVTGVPRHVRSNVHDAVDFYGGTFDEDLTSATTHIVTGDVHCASDKVACALRHGVAVVSAEWLQHVVDFGALRSFRDDAAEQASTTALSVADAAVNNAASEPASDTGAALASPSRPAPPTALPAAAEWPTPPLQPSPAVRTPQRHPHSTMEMEGGTGPAFGSPAVHAPTGHSLGAVSMDSAAEVASLEATVLRPDGVMIHTPVPASSTRRKQHRSESPRRPRRSSQHAFSVLNALAREPPLSAKRASAETAVPQHETISDRVRSRRASQDAAPMS